ncbi:Pestheic acid cluster transcriptional regulator [Lachnellula willkommii]|uniref:Pestheic acid cluster transcriptional regulator n=1 Tax=Lachnellula willkommii TaxID=215461 RepID=A0A559MCK0_9HELO|nr:Pestheic acid cluster transcriptional regulator [Lachnellula willkommii]
MSAVPQVRKSPKGCWTCKHRKIGCDRNLPACSNCLRTRRTCQGYGLKLIWPDDGDRRRSNFPPRSTNSNHFILSVDGSGDRIYVLNISREGMLKDIKRNPPGAAIVRWQSRSNCLLDPSTSLKFGYEAGLTGQEPSILQYYTGVLSRIVTTIDDMNNGFRTTLLPVALSRASNAATGLLHAVYSLSAYHLKGHDAAIRYKLLAIKYLSRSLQEGEDAALAQFAASMMLCIGDVFDSVDGSWPNHLAAAKSLSAQLPNGDHNKDLLFLQTLLEYHDILKGYSSGRISSTDSISSADTITMPRESPDDAIIIGALGCSRELMNLIALITRLQSVTPLPDHLMILPCLIHTRLGNLVQIPLINADAKSGQLDSKRILQTAELYRLASLIYLHTTLLPPPRSSSQLQSLVSRSLGLLEMFPVCTSPWPLFLTALEVNNDTDRVRVLHVLEVMQRVRRIGNVDVVQKVFETFWNQMDLRDPGHYDERFDWRELFDMRGRLPSFI